MKFNISIPGFDIRVDEFNVELNHPIDATHFGGRLAAYGSICDFFEIAAAAGMSKAQIKEVESIIDWANRIEASPKFGPDTRVFFKVGGMTVALSAEEFAVIDKNLEEAIELKF